MRDDNELEVDELFNPGDMVLLTLKNQEHYVGEFRYMDDLGVQMILESRTAYEIEKQEIPNPRLNRIVITEEEKKLRGATVIIDVSKPYLQMLKKPVKMLVKWENIDEMCSATDLAENAAIENFAQSLENGEFNKLIEKTKKDVDNGF